MKNLCILTALSASLIGCTDEPEPEGLTVTIDNPDHVGGSFSRGGFTLQFEFARADETLLGEYRRTDGEHLVSSTLIDNHELMVVRDGKLVIDTIVGSPNPDLQGDPAVLEELAAAPELLLIDDLKLALGEVGVDEALFDPPMPKTAIQDAYWGSDGYYHMAPGETGKFGTQPFWWKTQVVMRNFSGRCVTVNFNAGLAGFETRIVPAWGRTDAYGYWWANWLYITPLNAWVDWSYLGIGVCGPGEIGAFTRHAAE